MWLRKKNPQIDQLGTLFHLCFFPFSPPQCFPEAFLFCSKAVFLTKKCGFLNPQSSHPQPLMGDPNHSIEGLQSLIDLPNATQKNQHNEFTGSRRLDRGHLWEKNRLTFFICGNEGYCEKYFFTTGRASTKHFLRRIFLRQNVSHRNYTKLKCWGSQYGFFFLDFCQNSESGSRGSTPCLVYHNSGRKVLVAFLGRLFFCWLARAQFVSITDTVP